MFTNFYFQGNKRSETTWSPTGTWRKPTKIVQREGLQEYEPIGLYITKVFAEF